MRNTLLIPLVILGLSGCSLVPEGERRSDGSPVASGSQTDGNARSARVNAPTPIARNSADQQCLTELGQAGARFDALPDRYLDQGCTNLGTVMVHALASDRGQLGISNIGPVTCPVSSAFAAWARFGADRAARQVFGKGLSSIQTMGSYSCRNVAGTGRRSAHASADAIDIGGFVLEDGTRISVKDGWNGNRKEREFLRIVQRSACRRFSTVLGPDYNAAHHDHFHFEGVISGNSYCR